VPAGGTALLRVLRIVNGAPTEVFVMSRKD
jgi:hypothetical protein